MYNVHIIYIIYVYIHISTKLNIRNKHYLNSVKKYIEFTLTVCFIKSYL